MRIQWKEKRGKGERKRKTKLNLSDWKNLEERENLLNVATISPEPDVQPNHQDNTLSNHLVGSMVTETGRDMENMFGATADEAIHQDLSNQHQQEGVQDEGSWRQSVLHSQKRKDSTRDDGKKSKRRKVDGVKRPSPPPSFNGYNLSHTPW